MSVAPLKEATPATQRPLANRQQEQQQHSNNPTRDALREGIVSPSRTLDPPSLGLFESRLGYNFANVRIHDNSEAAKSASKLDADAYSLGNDVVFATGKFKPGTPSGDFLMTHELVHTIQQRDTSPPNIANVNANVSLSTPSDLIESEASSVARQAMSETRNMPNISISYPKDRLVVARQQAMAVSHESGVFPPPSAKKAVPITSQSAAVDVLLQPVEESPSSANSSAKEIHANALVEPSPVAATSEQARPAREGREAKGFQEHEAVELEKELEPDISSEEGKQPPLPGVAPLTKPATEDKEALGKKKEEKKSPRSPDEDPAFQATVSKVEKTAKRERRHAPAKQKAAEAAKAAKGPPNEVSSQAAGAQVGKMDAQEPKPFDRSQFKAQLLAKVQGIAPRTLEQADEFKERGGAASIKRDIVSAVDSGKEVAQGPIKQTTKEAPDTRVAKRKEVEPLPSHDAGATPSAKGAEQAAPKPKTGSEISLAEGSQSLDQKMKSASVNDTQLQESNEPQFVKALGAKNDAQSHAQSAPLVYREAEQSILSDSQSQATAVSKTELQSMHSARDNNFAKVSSEQLAGKEKDEQKRAEISSHVEGLYETTKQKVETRLAKLDEDTNRIFDTGAEHARLEFEGYVTRRMAEYKEERYSGLGAARWVTDKLLGLPDEVNRFYEEGREGYIKKMDEKIDEIASTVELGLNDAKNIISEGRKQVQQYLESLPEDLKQFGEEAASKIQSKFDSLGEAVEEKKDQLIDSLSKKYTENLGKMDERIAQMKEENGGLVGKAIDAIGSVIETILELKNMFLGVLKRAAAAISKIIKNPIGFLSNLVRGVKAGLHNFVSNIGTHLKKGLMGWLFGALAQAGIQLPESFDLKGILSLVMQVLGLTYTSIRRRAVGILGEDMVSKLEQAAEIFKILITEGPGGLWEHIKEKLGDLKAMVIDEIENFVREKVIIAGISWLVGLLNPAAAFIKAAKAIYDIVMFFVTRGSQIMSLVNAIIDSVSALADGAIGTAAAKVEDALGKAVPVAISFLASLLGLGGISDKVRKIIEKIQQPINKAIDWVINKSVSLVKTVGGLLGGEEKKGLTQSRPEERTDEQKKMDLDSAIHDANKILRNNPLSTKEIRVLLADIEAKYRMKHLELVIEKKGKKGTHYVKGAINPTEEGERIIRDLTEDSGFVTTITSILGPPHGRRGYEKDLPSTADFPPGSEAPHERAHSHGQGTGRESPAAIRRAPVDVNQRLQNRGIEQFLRGLFERVKNDPNTEFSYTTVTKSFWGTTRMESITYQLEAEIEGKKRIVLVATITIAGTRQAPTAKANIDYVSNEFSQFLIAIAEDIFEKRLD